ncbi:hypothetical protein [Silvanigrella sp.]|uniref:hypothetical protein n=1 Tax=Silvanigrella sp. TaxID=2024976 RepID=UPI0037C8ED0E
MVPSNDIHSSQEVSGNAQESPFPEQEESINKEDSTAKNLLNAKNALVVRSASDESSITSDAYNFKNLSQTVDARTGALSISYQIAEVVGNGFEDPSFSLSINYSSLSSIATKGFGLGKGWNWNLTRFNPESRMISLSSGGSYKVDFGKGNLKYYKLKDLKITIDRKQNILTLKYKDGKEEQLDLVNGNLMKLTNAEGHSAEFNYINKNRLESISYKNPVNQEKLKKIEISYYSDSLIEVKRHNGSAKPAVTLLTKGQSGSILHSIEDPLKQKVTLSYLEPKDSADFSKYSLIKKILYPTGTSINVTYLKKGLSSSKEGLSFPAVSKITTIVLPQSEKNQEETSYYYGENDNNSRNYLGRGYRFVNDEDPLFFTPNNYKYYTIEEKPAANGKIIFTIRTYNHFHQLIEEEIRVKNEGNTLQKKEFIYPEWASRNFDALEPNYNLPKEIRTAYFNGSNSRIESIKQEYDNYGNLLKTEDASGIITEYKYLPVSENFNGIVHLPQRIVTSSKFEKSSKIKEYVYETAKNAEGKAFQRLKATMSKYSPTLCKIEESTCGTVYKTEIHSYAAQMNLGNGTTSIISIPSFTKILAADRGKCKVTQSHYQYSSNGKVNTVTKDFVGSMVQAEKPIQMITTYNAFTQQVERKTTTQNKIADISYQYDVLGRVVKETVGQNTGKPSSVSYQYSNPELGKSALQVITSTGQANYIVYDSLGRIIEKYQDHYPNPDKKLFSYEYTLSNQKRKETAFNKDVNGEHYNLSVEYKYDAFGREKEVISADKTVKYTEYDDVALTQSSFIKSLISGESSPKSLVKLNISKKPVSTSLYSPSGSHHSTSTNQYDGFGNLIQSVDVLGNKMRYEYDLKGNKIADIYNDGKRIHYVYDVLFEDQITEKSVTTSDGKNILLGQRKYNELG